MTNNKTIVDSVDVSECEHQTCGNCDINFEEWNGEIIRYLDCSNYPNCHFKQFKRKEQENEKYKQSLDEIEKYIKGSSGYYIPYGAIEIIQYIINKAKDGE